MDDLIANSSPARLQLISQDPDSDPLLVARIDLRNFYDELSFLEEFKGTADYQNYVQMAVDDATEAVREALRNEPYLSEELETALYKPYSEEIEEKSELNVESKTQIANIDKLVPEGNLPSEPKAKPFLPS